MGLRQWRTWAFTAYTLGSASSWGRELGSAKVFRRCLFSPGGFTEFIPTNAGTAVTGCSPVSTPCHHVRWLAKPIWTTAPASNDVGAVPRLETAHPVVFFRVLFKLFFTFVLLGSWAKRVDSPGVKRRVDPSSDVTERRK